ncbi:Gpr7 transmembrane protein [Thraustotheca clavata]|uniref:Gpr7 transmembrane protein n=1 Tax=Thraustotheca clavata TaxID=74557 RepID=A0A1V9Y7P1_9STRA|nr:Gpr7 transmembrane protein [Thraustotheca clavata]
MLRGIVAAALLCVEVAFGSIYPVQNELYAEANGESSSEALYFPFQRAEKMFGSNQGPLFAKHGVSTIELDVHGVNVTSAMNGWRMVVFHYQANNLQALADAEGNIGLFACSLDNANFALSGMSHYERHEFTIANESIAFNTTYLVNSSGWIDSLVFVCSGGQAGQTILDFEGTLAVRNTYGYLPAVFYGLLPFSGFLSLGYFMLAFFFAILLCCHRQEAIALQYGIFCVLVLGTVSSAVWFIALFEMNAKGAPFSWPLPPLYIAAVTCDAGMRTFARILLLVVCLGYGIVRNQLPKLDKFLIVLISLSYFGTGVADDLIREGSADRGAGIGRHRPSIWAIMQLCCNLVFVLWIYLSLESILKQLRADKQFAKLRMYELLAWSLAGFVLFFTCLTGIAVSSRIGLFEWPIEWEWMQLVAWPILNFIVCAAMCIIWRPTARSSQFAFSTQLPMTDEDDKATVEMSPTVADTHVSPRFTIGEEDDEDDHEHAKGINST